MQHLNGKFILIVLIICCALVSVACSSTAVPNEVPGEDVDPNETATNEETGEQPVSDTKDLEIEARVVPKETAMDTPVPPPTEPSVSEPITDTADLPTEIIEPISPISPTTTAQGSNMSTHDNAQPIPGTEALMTLIVEDLSQQTGVPPDEIKLVSMEAVDWNDASLGCPQEGFMYAQVITPGYNIILEANGEQYVYHTDERTSFILCEQ